MNGLLLLDASRSTARRWAGKTPCGIDRVADAYCRHYRATALAVLQLRGRPLVLGPGASRRLFDLLDSPQAEFRRSLPALLARAITLRERPADLHDALYLNVSHSNFDLAAHQQWVSRNGLRPVYFVHDMIPVRHPQFSTPYRTRRNRRRALAALQHGTGVITNSQVSLAELSDFAASQGLPLPPALAAHPGSDVWHDAPQWNPEDSPYFVVLGTIEPRKNHGLLLRTWERLTARLGKAAPRLVIAGQRGLRSSTVIRQLAASPSLRGKVEVRGGLDDREVEALLRGSRGLLLPTLAEGYGLPLAEALQLGVPVLANDLPVFREIGQGLALLISVERETDWQEQIELLTAETTPAPHDCHRNKRFRPTTWDDHFSAVNAWLDALAHSPFDRLGLQQHHEGRPLRHRDRKIA